MDGYIRYPTSELVLKWGGRGGEGEEVGRDVKTIIISFLCICWTSRSWLLAAMTKQETNAKKKKKKKNLSIQAMQTSLFFFVTSFPFGRLYTMLPSQSVSYVG